MKNERASNTSVRKWICRGKRYLLAILMAGAVTPQALAQISLCTGTPFTGGYVNFNPANPDAAQAVAISVGRVAYKPVGVTAIVTGSVIDITLNATFIGILPPPVECDTVNVGPLAPGTYTVNFFVLDVGIVGGTPFLAVTTSLTVGAAPIPTTSQSVLAALAVALTILAFFWIRRRQFRAAHGILK